MGVFDHITNNKPHVTETTAEVYDYAKNVLPPIYVKGFWGLGEGFDHAAGGEIITIWFISKEGKYFAVLGTEAEARQRFARYYVQPKDAPTRYFDPDEEETSAAGNRRFTVRFARVYELSEQEVREGLAADDLNGLDEAEILTELKSAAERRARSWFEEEMPQFSDESEDFASATVTLSEEAAGDAAFITLRMPRGSWETLCNTLHDDAESAHFDYARRAEISAALETTENI